MISIGDPIFFWNFFRVSVSGVEAGRKEASKEATKEGRKEATKEGRMVRLDLFVLDASRNDKLPDQVHDNCLRGHSIHGQLHNQSRFGWVCSI